jgi:NarL family two-component system response regulator YdfI
LKRVFIIAPSEVTRAGLESVLAASPGLAVVGSSPDETIVESDGDLQPDVLLLVLSRQTEEALSAIIALSAQLDAPLVVLTDGFDRSWAGAAVRAGARAILPGDATSAEILAAIEAVSVGLVVLPAAVTDVVLSETPDDAEPPPAGDGPKLTAREIEILGMIAEGLGNKEIAWRLSISEHTVKFHIGSIFTKLGAQSRTEAVTIGLRHGLIMI